ncbi:globin family protein [Flexithrix dorotheae]|uniref:globin family protein n=1 Tax=Flexithrix dorotheae TaxID=70993 RepID=UPI00035CA314|nr:globin family protein [Flexithrix dorotheae]
MTEKQKVMVQASFAKVEPIADQAAEIFYGKLFELDPSLQPLFKSDIKSQGRKLMTMIKAAVAGLDDLGTLVPVVQNLGKRHVGYGVPESSYKTVGEALIFTLGAGLGEDFTEEVKAAWVEVYGVLSSTMIAASNYS